MSPLPQVDFPTISVNASLPGASPETVATSVASPLERHLGQIADVTEMTSISSVGSARVTLQFGLDRDIDGAARDVQAAINAARADLPTSLKSNPTYRKVNPADAPILILALTSKTLTRGQMYDAAANVMQQKLSQTEGIGQVIIGGAASPAVRVELNPTALFKYGIGLEDVRAALASANANSPKGAIEDGPNRYQLYTNDQANHAADYMPLVVAYRNGGAGAAAGCGGGHRFGRGSAQPGFVRRPAGGAGDPVPQPGANIIARSTACMRPCRNWRRRCRMTWTSSRSADRTTTIRASLHDTRADAGHLRPPGDGGGVRVPAQPAGDDHPGDRGADLDHRHVRAMYLLGYSLDNLSLMALTVATGFVVDDAIVVLENIARHIEAGDAAGAGGVARRGGGRASPWCRSACR